VPSPVTPPFKLHDDCTAQWRAKVCRGVDEPLQVVGGNVVEWFALVLSEWHPHGIARRAPRWVGWSVVPWFIGEAVNGGSVLAQDADKHHGSVSPFAIGSGGVECKT